MSKSQNFTQKHIRSTSYKSSERRGVVLLIALGMLGLFSILTVTYVVFTSQARQASVSIDAQSSKDTRPQDLMPLVIKQILVGTTDTRSAGFGADLLGDLYGYDSVRTRVAHRRSGTTPTVPIAPLMRGEMFDNPNTPAIESTLFRFPIGLAAWNNSGAGGLEEDLPNYQGPTVVTNATAGRPNHTERLDDAFTGRIVTFLDGPLSGFSFHVIRSFGEDATSAAVFNGGSIADETLLQYNLVIDLAEAPVREVMINGEVRNLFEIAARFPVALLYGPGPDNAPGEANHNDQPDLYVSGSPNTSGPTDDLAELGTSNTDDIGHRLVINGQVFNGRGVNAGFDPLGGTPLTSVTPRNFDGSTRHPQPVLPLSSQNLLNVYPGWSDSGMTYALQPNAKYAGAFQQSEPDEPYDAADLENMFLAWQPSDRPAGVNIHAGEAEANSLINQAIVPSYHRPALFNYILNQPINGRTYADIIAGVQTGDTDRLRTLVRRLRRASLRPLPFADEPPSNTNPTFPEDIDGDGEQIDGAPLFSGSNLTTILNSPSGLNPAGDLNEIRRLALWLVNGPWDVDNDGDGVPDSVWLDFQLPMTTAADGTLVKPLIAPLIEDMDGKVNINTAGSFAHLTTNFFDTDPSIFSPDNLAGATPTTFRRLARGFGYGPADISPRLLLDPWNSKHFPSTFVAPSTTDPNPFIPGLNTNSLYFQILSSRYGGKGTRVAAPGVDYNSGTAPIVPADDLISQLIHPTRRAVHSANSPMGLPMDMHGRGALDRDLAGNLEAQNLNTAVPVTPLTMNETINDPYEMAIGNIPLGDDEPFGIDEMVAVLQRNTPNAYLLKSRLLELLEQDLSTTNSTLDRKITVESRSQRVPEFTAYANATDFVMSLLRRMPGFTGVTDPFSGATVAEREAAELAAKRMLAIELRKGTKLNLNRPLGNGRDSTTTFPSFIDESSETWPVVPGGASNEPAFPTTGNPSASVAADYVPEMIGTNDFSDLSPQELLARNIYSLMVSLVRDPTAAGGTTNLLYPAFPYPTGMLSAPSPTAQEIQRANRYAARRLAQWAVNVVDFRDHDAVMTRFRFDEDPFDVDGWADASGPAPPTVWGMEVTDLILSESIAFHNLNIADTGLDNGANDGGAPAENKERDGTMAPDVADTDLDQLRLPQASAYVEILNSRTPSATTTNSLHFPVEIYGRDDDRDPTTALTDTNSIDLARTVGTGNATTPVWRLAVGVPADLTSPHFNSPRWISDDQRLAGVALDPFSTTANPTLLQTDRDKANNSYRHTLAYTPGPDGILAFEDGTPADNRVLAIDRVVWFTGLNPTSVNANARGNLQPAQIFRNTLASDPNDPMNNGDTTAVPRLAPGQFAVIAPRLTTYFGETTACNEGSLFQFNPSSQRLELAYNANMNNSWTFKYYNNNDAEQDPVYFEDNTGNYSVRSVVPIIAQSLRPNENTPAAANWAAYWNALNGNGTVNRGVDYGFNISAPLADQNYYPPPLDSATLNDTPTPGINQAYTVFDAYYNADTGTGVVRDQPVDDAAGTPLTTRGWRRGGTHQDASTLFLQRLADPTRVHDATSNPYITIDSLTIDLTVFSGHENLGDTVLIDGAVAPVDPGTNPSTGFASSLRMDTRRKIPDTSKDRYAYESGTSLVYRALSSFRENVLQRGATSTATVFFPYELNATPSTENTTVPGVDLDNTTTPFPATLGYLNREYGVPRTNTALLPELVGLPQNTYFPMQPWFDRDYSSPLEVLSVPAASPARIALETSPGTVLDTNPSASPSVVNETRTSFGHLLGFEHRYNEAEASPTIVGPGPGFEQFLDFVDTGPIYADGERWIEPSQVQLSGLSRFDRITETLRAPFNNITLHRVPGKINLNTTPDYAGVTGGNGITTNFDINENPEDPSTISTTAPTRNASRYYPSVTANDGFVGDGSVYQSLAWGISSFQELDNQYAIPTLENESNFYASTQDSPYGYNFKGFIESRTGFTQPILPTAISSSYYDLLNRQTSPFYPSRFVGIFGPTSTRGFPQRNSPGVFSVETYLSQNQEYGSAYPKQLVDMGMLRPNPDMDRRDIGPAAIPLTLFDQRTEPTAGVFPEWRSQTLSTPLFDRTEPELHREGRVYDRTPIFRFRNSAKLANLTTHHSNVFMVRFTVGYFRVDPQSLEIGQEYGIDTGENTRQRGLFVIDRTIPVSYEPSVSTNATNTVIFSSELE